MGEETSAAMNLGLNPGSGPEWMVASGENENDEADDPLWRLHELVRIRECHSLRMRLQVPTEQNVSVGTNHLLSDSGNPRSITQTNDSTSAETRIINEVSKTCERNNGILESKVSKKTNDLEKGNGNQRSFFDCSICLDLSTDPVLTCCGHLFCWSCLYQWLSKFSGSKECPVCKGEISEKNITPIYGRGTSTPKAEKDGRIPVRPMAKHVESLRNFLHRAAEDVIQDAHRFDSFHDLAAQASSDSIGVRGREPLLRGSEARAFNEEQQLINDTDSFSSITAVNSENSLDTVSDIDSFLAFVNSPRRENEAIRVSDLLSGESRASRRRRLN